MFDKKMSNYQVSSVNCRQVNFSLRFFKHNSRCVFEGLAQCV